MAFLAIFVTVAIVVAGIPLIVMLFDYNPHEYKQLVALDEQRSMIAYQISYKAAHAGWFTRWKFKRYLARGGGNFL